jgi:hypothetical protein
MKYSIIKNQFYLKPQDIVLLLKLATLGEEPWQQKGLSQVLKISQSEISQGISRLQYSGLLGGEGKSVRRLALLDFLQFGLPYIFAQRPGAIVRGIPTAHSASPLNELITSEEIYVWPYPGGKVRGQSIVPLYPSVPNAVLADSALYEILALVDALRVGKMREKELAVVELRKRIVTEPA